MRDLLTRLVVEHFPRQNVKYAVGYGSAVFKQANYGDEKCVIDMLLMVDNTEEFHDKNLTTNYSHYSYRPKRLPLSVTDGL